MINKKNYEEILACPQCRSSVVIKDYVVCNNKECSQIYNIIDDIPVMIKGDPNKIKEDVLYSKTETSMFEKKFLGVPYFKIDYNIKKLLYKFFRIRFPKLKDQRDYWLNRGNEYCDEFRNKGYENLEIFFQDLVVNELKQLQFDSIFEAGCGFGWNIKRFKNEFPETGVGGLDFSHTQLLNGKNKYIKDETVLLTEGDATEMPLKNNAYDIGFSLGVFMNINKNKIGKAIDEMVRVCKKYIIHMEYDENNASRELREGRAFKTNIVSHDYKKLYEKRGLKILKYLTVNDFGGDYQNFIKDKNEKVGRWESWEGPSKYILVIIKNK